MSYDSAKQIQWFPGHMTKTLRLIEAEIKNVDVVLQLLDARIPHSSLNPELLKAASVRPQLFVLNKKDLADNELTQKWMEYFKKSGDGCVAISSKGDVSAVQKIIDDELAQLIQRREVKGMAGTKIRVMVLGIPNVGKSTFINSFAKSGKAIAADRPGVTRGKQWVSAGKYDLLDMPGVLWKKFEDPVTAVNLALIGSIKDDILDIEELAVGLLDELRSQMPKAFRERYKLSEDDIQLKGYDLLCLIAKKRGMLMLGGAADTERAATMITDEFRAAKIGKITLERPCEYE